MCLADSCHERLYLRAMLLKPLGWIVLKTDDPKAIYQHAAEWGEFLNWETTPVFTDEEAGPIVAKVYS